MDHLTPDDLLIRESPKDDESWFDSSDVDKAGGAREIRLERFQTLEHVIREHPINVDPYLELARIYLQKSRWVDAKRILDLAVAKFPEDEDANFLLEEAQINRSLQLLDEARRAHRAEPTRLTQEALDRCNLELNVLREKVCRSRLSRDASQNWLNLPLATALENLGKVDEAIECLQSILHVPQLRAKAALNLGKLMERAGRIPQALSAFRRAAMFRVPEPPEDIKLAAISSAANLAEKHGLVDSARRYCEMLLEIQPNNPAIQDRLRRLEQMPL